MSSVTIRPANVSDAQAVATLSGCLGYAVDAPSTAEFLEQISEEPGHAVWVAEYEGMVAGWIEFATLRSVTTPHEVLIIGLVVDEACRGKGIGKRLVLAVEDWGFKQGLAAVRVRSQVKRSDAHRFYEGLGYGLVKSQHMFRKGLHDSGPG